VAISLQRLALKDVDHAAQVIRTSFDEASAEMMKADHVLCHLAFS
jgi:predicted SAM-dependent methyltransferase